ncbi:hypothetical protein BHE74_00023191 [Ensete ventricosum]|nr:hypothetical protein BHE74_00023191 [Ensete ventricosum]
MVEWQQGEAVAARRCSGSGAVESGYDSGKGGGSRDEGTSVAEEGATEEEVSTVARVGRLLSRAGRQLMRRGRRGEMWKIAAGPTVGRRQQRVAMVRTRLEAREKATAVAGEGCGCNFLEEETGVAIAAVGG